MQFLCTRQFLCTSETILALQPKLNENSLFTQALLFVTVRVWFSCQVSLVTLSFTFLGSLLSTKYIVRWPAVVQWLTVLVTTDMSVSVKTCWVQTPLRILDGVSSESRLVIGKIDIKRLVQSTIKEKEREEKVIFTILIEQIFAKKI